jgi:putative lipoprotein
MKKIVLVILIAILLLPSLAACGGSQTQNTPATGASVTGTVNKRDRKAIAPSDTIEIRLVDKAAQDQPIGQQDIHAGGKQLPLPFEIQYNPDDISADKTYEIQVQIVKSSGDVIYKDAAEYPVITQGNPTSNVEVFVEPVQ